MTTTALEELEGQLVASTQFLEGYFQIHLDRAHISIINPAVLNMAGQVVQAGDDGFVDGINGLVGHRLMSAKVDGDELVFMFEGEIALSVSLRAADYRWGPEGVIVDGETAWNVF